MTGEEPEPETGRWYRFLSGGTMTGRPVKVRRYEDQVVLGRFADGSERLIPRSQLGDQVEGVVPGMTERCAVCGGLKREPPLNPCPNCRGAGAP